MLSAILLRLSLPEIVADLPHDAGAVIVYALVLVFAGFIWAGSRGKGPDKPPTSPTEHHHAR